MNAILRENHEAHVLTNEAIEVHLSYLRPAVDALAEKIDQANNDRAAGDAALGVKIDKLDERLTKTQASVEGLKWFVGSLTIIASAVSIAHSLGWL